jgi:hypothetical protein
LETLAFLVISFLLILGRVGHAPGLSPVPICLLVGCGVIFVLGARIVVSWGLDSLFPFFLVKTREFPGLFFFVPICVLLKASSCFHILVIACVSVW